MAEQGKKTEEFGRSIYFFADWSSETSRTGLHCQYVTSRQGTKTLNIELAPILQAKESPDWTNKITLQLSCAELVDFCAVLLGFRRTTSGSYHGSSRNKGFKLYSNPAKGALVALSQQGRQLQHILSQADRATLTAFCLTRLADEWMLGVSDCISILSNTETLPIIVELPETGSPPV